MAEPYIGQVIMFCGNFAIQGFAGCDGQLMPINQNTSLFSLLGTTYGGNGTTSFGLPDLRGRIPLHVGDGPGLPNFVQGQSGGSLERTLGANNIPPHSHSFALPCNNLTANTEDPENAYMGVEASKPVQFSTAPNQLMGNVNTDTVGGPGDSFSIQNPYLVIRFLIALQGTYPSRN